MTAGRTTVVGAVIVEGGRVLAARRTRPSELAGFWEFPGGKVEPGEDPKVALAREIREELSAAITVLDEVVSPSGPWLISEKYVLRLFSAAPSVGDPTPGADHDEIRWLGDGELDELNWLPSDRAALETVRQVLLHR